MEAEGMRNIFQAEEMAYSRAERYKLNDTFSELKAVQLDWRGVISPKIGRVP